MSEFRLILLDHITYEIFATQQSDHIIFGWVRQTTGEKCNREK